MAAVGRVLDQPPGRTWYLLAAAGIACAAIGALFMPRSAGSAAPVLSALLLLLLAAPSFLALVRWAGTRRGLAALGVVSLMALVIELAAVVTGIPYGNFGYSEGLGYLVMDLVPWVVPFAFIPLLLGAWAAAYRLGGKDPALWIGTTAVLLVGVDLAIDPGAVAAGFWAWDIPGAWYGVPVVNFLGWLFTGCITAAVLTALLGVVPGERGPPPLMVASSLLLALPLWAGYCAAKGLPIPAILGAALWLLLIRPGMWQSPPAR
jgi:putative membrane protein